jgi:AmiR/NasT family two-component response regulator
MKNLRLKKQSPRQLQRRRRDKEDQIAGENHLHIFVHTDEADRIHQHIDSIGNKIIMAMNQQTRDVIAAFDTETTKIADRITALIAQLDADTTNAEVQAALAPQLDRLRALGANPETPIPA